MFNLRTHTLTLLSTAAVALSACGPKSDAGSTNTDSGADTDTGATTSDSATTSTTTDATSTSSTTTDGSTGAGFINTDTSDGTTGPTEPQPNGSACETGEDCVSGECYQVPFQGGVCSECDEDADCMENGGPGTCALGTVGYAVCTDGSAGSMCEKDSGGCQRGLVCATVIDTGGFFPADYCSECETDADCSDGQLCNPDFDATTGEGQKSCVDPGTVENNEMCDHVGSGDMACMSGYCDPADVMGFVEIGICGECDPSNDEGCEVDQTCMDPVVDTQTYELQGATCG